MAELQKCTVCGGSHTNNARPAAAENSYANIPREGGAPDATVSQRKQSPWGSKHETETDLHDRWRAARSRKASIFSREAHAEQTHAVDEAAGRAAGSGVASTYQPDGCGLQGRIEGKLLQIRKIQRDELVTINFVLVAAMHVHIL